MANAIKADVTFKMLYNTISEFLKKLDTCEEETDLSDLTRQCVFNIISTLKNQLVNIERNLIDD